MPDLVCNTSPLQYLHQLGLLHLLPKLGGRVSIPPAVVEELAAGRRAGVDLPDPTQLDWVRIHLQALRFHVAPQTRSAVLTLAGES